MSKESLCSLTSDARPHCPTYCRFNFSVPWDYVSHEVSIDPVDDARIDVSHLERYGYLRVLRYVSVDDLSNH